MVRRIVAALVAVACATAPDAQESSIERVELRVVTTRADGTFEVDRGASDGVEEGQLVLFFPRSGGTFDGSVVEVLDRSAFVMPHIAELELPSGTAGEVLIPVTALPDEPAGQRTIPDAPVDHDPWSNADEAWNPGMPLLSYARAVQPHERPVQFNGRAYFWGQYLSTNDPGEVDSAYRSGADMKWDNLFGNGGTLHIDGELAILEYGLGGDERVDDTNLRVDRLSYSLGGTRFIPARLTAGRFLQVGVPEFGVLDGAEYALRMSGGDAFGVSLGFMPEPNGDFRSGNDFQVAAFYRWVADETETLALTGGVQHTWHNGAPDRELLLAKLEYLPLEGWRLLGTVWIDHYDSGDDVKGSGFEVSQAHASASRRWDDGTSLRFAYARIVFPETDADLFTVVPPETLANFHDDRLSSNGVLPLSERCDLLGEVGVWVDDIDRGGDAELGLGIDDLVLERSRANMSVFAVRGKFDTTVGARLGYARQVDNGRWSVSYEWAQHDITGFEDDNDDLYQQRLSASRDYRFGSWDLSLIGTAFLWDGDDAWSLGLNVHKVL